MSHDGERHRPAALEPGCHLHIIHGVSGWAYHNQARAIAKFASPDFRVTLAEHGRSPRASDLLGATAPDLVLVLPPPVLIPVVDAIRARRWPTRVIVAWSRGWPRDQELFEAMHARADAVFVKSAAYWEAMGRRPRTHYVPNGVDLDLFRIRRPIESRAPRVLWTGSQHHRALKGYDELLLPLRDRLRASDIDLDLHLVDSRSSSKRSPEAMSRWYNTGRVYVCASASEGTPNPILEAAACGCAIVSTAVGNVPELIADGQNGFVVERDLDHLHEAVLRACDDHQRLASQAHGDIAAWSWRRRVPEILQLMREILRSPRTSELGR